MGLPAGGFHQILQCGAVWPFQQVQHFGRLAPLTGATRGEDAFDEAICAWARDRPGREGNESQGDEAVGDDAISVEPCVLRTDGGERSVRQPGVRKLFFVVHTPTARGIRELLVSFLVSNKIHVGFMPFVRRSLLLRP
jgi:hypothetical protein